MPFQILLCLSSWNLHCWKLPLPLIHSWVDRLLSLSVCTIHSQISFGVVLCRSRDFVTAWSSMLENSPPFIGMVLSLIWKEVITISAMILQIVTLHYKITLFPVTLMKLCSDFGVWVRPIMFQHLFVWPEFLMAETVLLRCSSSLIKCFGTVYKQVML